MNYIIRPIKKAEIKLLDDFLYEAIFIREGEEKPLKEGAERLRYNSSSFPRYPRDDARISEILSSFCPYPANHPGFPIAIRVRELPVVVRM